jgi:hypothetical protein
MGAVADLYRQDVPTRIERVRDHQLRARAIERFVFGRYGEEVCRVFDQTSAARATLPPQGLAHFLELSALRRAVSLTFDVPHARVP